MNEFGGHLFHTTDEAHLASIDEHGLLSNRRRRPVLLKIDARILYGSGVKVALGRANRSGTKIYRPGGAFYKMDWEIITGQVDRTNIEYPWRYAAVCDYEILVPKQVPRDFILGTV